MGKLNLKIPQARRASSDASIACNRGELTKSPDLEEVQNDPQRRADRRTNQRWTIAHPIPDRWNGHRRHGYF